MLTEDSDLWVTVFGGGSFCLGKGHKTWRGPKAYRITAEQAEGVLAWKADHPGADWLLVTAFEPDFEPDPDQLTGMLTLTDVRLGTLRRPGEPDDAHEPPTDDDGEPVLAHPCEHCEASFPSAPILRRHVMLHHTYQAAEVEQAARSDRGGQGREGRAGAPRARRPLRTPSRRARPGRRVPRPSLWPPLPSEL